MDIAGVHKDEFFAANALMRERCHGMYLDCKDKRLLDSYHDYIFQHLQAVHE